MFDSSFLSALEKYCDTSFCPSMVSDEKSADIWTGVLSELCHLSALKTCPLCSVVKAVIRMCPGMDIFDCILFSVCSVSWMWRGVSLANGIFPTIVSSDTLSTSHFFFQSFWNWDEILDYFFNLTGPQGISFSLGLLCHCPSPANSFITLNISLISHTGNTEAWDPVFLYYLIRSWCSIILSTKIKECVLLRQPRWQG